MNPEAAQVDIAEAAERQGRSTQTIRRYIKLGRLPAMMERVAGRDGRPVLKVMIQVSDLDAVFPRPDTPEERARHIREIVAAAPPLTEAQRITITVILYGGHARNR